MSKFLLSLLIITILITLSQCQSIMLGTWQSFTLSGCSGDYTLTTTQNSNGYQMTDTKGRSYFQNVTIASDYTISGEGLVWTTYQPYTLQCTVPITGVFYNQYSFLVKIGSCSVYSGATYDYVYSGTPKC